MSDPRPTPRQVLGARGEAIAAKHLTAAGCRLRDRNWRAGRYGEIDLVVMDGETLAFVEVRTRQGRAFGPPELSITPRKAQRMYRLGLAYLAAHDLDDIAWRLDVVAVEIDRQGRVVRCEHLPNIAPRWS